MCLRVVSCCVCRRVCALCGDCIKCRRARLSGHHIKVLRVHWNLMSIKPWLVRSDRSNIMLPPSVHSLKERMVWISYPAWGVVVDVCEHTFN